MAERWLPVPGYENLYSVSTWGRVMYHRRRIDRRHTRPYWASGGLLAPRVGNDYGHLCVTLYDPLGKARKRYIHHLVAETFIPRVEGKTWVLHGPKGKRCNRVENLRWGDQSDNELDKYREIPLSDGTQDSSGGIG
jgi:hypothetical protein